MAQDTWAERDLPVLEAIVALSDEGRWHISSAHLAERTGLAEDQVQLALFALAGENPALFKFADTSDHDGPEIGWVYEPSA